MIGVSMISPDGDREAAHARELAHLLLRAARSGVRHHVPN
jgi:hypothetical protein